MLIHGDADRWNTLDAGAGAYKFVDPEGLRSEPEHDLAVGIRAYNESLFAGDTPRLVRERAAFLAGSVRGRRRDRVAVGLHRAGVDRTPRAARLDNDDGLVFLEVASLSH